MDTGINGDFKWCNGNRNGTINGNGNGKPNGNGTIDGHGKELERRWNCTELEACLYNSRQIYEKKSIFFIKLLPANIISVQKVKHVLVFLAFACIFCLKGTVFFSSRY